jgi:hypothetical protein
MLLKMNTSMAGPTFSVSTGDTRNFDTDEALRLVPAGIATPTPEAQAEYDLAVADKLAAEQAAIDAEAAATEPVGATVDNDLAAGEPDPATAQPETAVADAAAVAEVKPAAKAKSAKA